MTREPWEKLVFVKAWLQAGHAQATTIGLGTTLSCGGSSFCLHWAPLTLPNWRYQQSHKNQMTHNYLLLALTLPHHRAVVPRTETSSDRDQFCLANIKYLLNISDTWNKFLKSLFMTQRRKPFIRESSESDLPHHCLPSMVIKWQQHLSPHSEMGTEWLHLPSQENSNQFRMLLFPLHTLCSAASAAEACAASSP